MCNGLNEGRLSVRIPSVILSYITSKENGSKFVRKVLYKILNDDTDFRKYFCENCFDFYKEFNKLLVSKDYKLKFKILLNENSPRYGLAKYWFPDLNIKEFRCILELLEVFITDDMLIDLENSTKDSLLDSK